MPRIDPTRGPAPIALALALLLTEGSAIAHAQATSPAPASAAPKSVAEVQDRHDRALIRDLIDYIAQHPKGDDLDQAYMKVFDKAIEHDWFGDQEALAKQYLATYPDGPVRALARVVATMAHAQGGQFAEALTSYQALLDGLTGAEQEEFAATFADSLAGAAIAAGEIPVAHATYEALLKKFGAESPDLAQKVQGELARIARVGTPLPDLTVADLGGATLRFADLKGKYVLVDFWATWCAPCTAELPRIQAAYAKYRGKGFEVVGVSLDESREAVAEFVRARGLPWRQVHNATSNGDLVEAFGVRNIPASFLIDPSGRIIRLDLRGGALDRTLGTLIK